MRKTAAFAVLTITCLVTGTACHQDYGVTMPQFNSIEDCELALPLAICEELFSIYSQLSEMDGICAEAAEELLARLTTAGGLIYAPNDPEPAFMIGYTWGVDWPMYVTPNFMSGQWSGQRHQIVVHELVGHYIHGYSDTWMAQNNYGSECNEYN